MRTTHALLLLALLSLLGCQRPPMVMPTMFEQGRVDPFADVPENDKATRRTLFFASDRRYDIDARPWRQYGRQRSDWLDLGILHVGFGPEDAWPQIVGSVRGGEQGRRYNPRIQALVRYGQLDAPIPGAALPDHTPDPGREQNEATRVFVQQLNEAVARSAGKAITIYVHGFKNDFEQAALATAEYDLYAGGLGPFIVYAWPSYDSLWEYSHDRDSVRYTTAHARRFVEFLADEINAGRLGADKIHFIAHSSGAEIVGSVLRELALMSRDLPPAERAARWRIGSVLLVAPDVSTDVARERLLKEDLRGMYDQIVVYSSVRDRALRWASHVLYRTTRIGSIRESDLTERDRYWLQRAANVAVVDIDSQPNRDLVYHSHHRFSGAVASDILLCLRSNLTPAERGLVREGDQVVWRFADDYPERVTDAALKAYGQGDGDD